MCSMLVEPVLPELTMKTAGVQSELVPALKRQKDFGVWAS